MTELVYTLDQSHRRTYQKLVFARASDGRRVGSWDVEGVRIFFVALTVAAVLVGAGLLMPLATGRAVAYAELLVGLLLGNGMTIGSIRWHYRQMGKRALRPDGPTMSERRLTLTPEGVRTTSPHHDDLLRWSALDEVSVHDDVIVLWFEPAAGALVPRNAFADRAAESQFVESVRARIAEAKLSRSRQPLVTG